MIQNNAVRSISGVVSPSPLMYLLHYRDIPILLLYSTHNFATYIYSDLLVYGGRIQDIIHPLKPVYIRKNRQEHFIVLIEHQNLEQLV